MYCMLAAGASETKSDVCSDNSMQLSAGPGSAACVYKNLCKNERFSCGPFHEKPKFEI